MGVACFGAASDLSPETAGTLGAASVHRMVQCLSGAFYSTEFCAYAWKLAVLTTISKARKRAACLSPLVPARIVGPRPFECTGLVRVSPEINESGRIYANRYCEMV